MKILIIFIFCTIGVSSYAQIEFAGTVKDSTGTGLELANVIAINKESQKVESFSSTNTDGRFKLSLEKNTTYTIQASYIGLKTASVEVKTLEEAISKDITLYADSNLDAVELVYEMPVTIKGDTIVYNADSFNKGTERKLGDVLKNLPGVDVNDEGEIEVEGKKVSKVMVEGKDFFDGDSKLATKNIPANAVDKVQVLKNHTDVNQLKQVTNNQDNIAINIKLKEGKKNFWFGDITAGTGIAHTNGIYLVQPKLFYYSPEFSINLIGDINNIGELAFSRRDYWNFSGGFKMPSRQSGTNIDLGDNNLSFLTMQNNRAKKIETKFGAANFSYAPKKTLDISGFAIFHNNKTLLKEERSVNYTNTDLGIPNENTEDNTLQNSNLGMLKLSASYKPNVNNQLDYDIIGNIAKETQDQSHLSSVIGTTNEDENATPFSLKQSLNYYYTLNDKNIFAFEGQQVWKDEDPFYQALIEKNSPDLYLPTATSIGFDTQQANYNLAQEKRVISNQADTKIDYWYVLTKKSNLNFTLGNIFSQQKFTSELFQFLDNGEKSTPAPSSETPSENDISYRFTDVYAATHYTLKTGIFTITPGVSIHNYNLKNTQFSDEHTQAFIKVLPDFLTQIQLKKSEQITFNYRMQTQFTDVTNFARGLVMNDYNSFFNGNLALENALSHELTLSYFSFNMFNYTNIFGIINYSSRIDQIRNRTNFENVIRSSTPFNSSYADELLTASGRVQRRFKKIQASFQASFNYSKFNQLIQEIRSINENYTQNYRIGAETYFKKAPNIELAYGLTLQDNEQGNRRSTFYTHSPSITLDSQFLKAFTIKTTYTYNDFRNKEQRLNSFSFWDAELFYRKKNDSPWEFSIKATNILNTQEQSQSTNTAISVSTSTYYIQPRYTTFRVIYHL